MIGVLGEAWVWMQTTSEFTRLGAVAKSEANIETKVELLEHLRSGRYNDAAKMLEELLDKDLTRAAESASVGIKFSSDTLKAIATERKARKISGYEPANSTVGVAIQNVFRLAPQSEIAWQGTPFMSQDDNH